MTYILNLELGSSNQKADVFDRELVLTFSLNGACWSYSNFEMSSDWFNLFVHQGKEFFESVSRKGNDQSSYSTMSVNSAAASFANASSATAYEGSMKGEDMKGEDIGHDEKVESGTELSVEGKNTQISGAEKDIYESQLEQLQEQLVDIMIQNQEMANELDILKNSDAAKLNKELEKEQLRRRHLEEKLKKNEDGTSKLRRRKKKEGCSLSTEEFALDDGEISNNKTDISKPALEIDISKEEVPRSRFKRVNLWLYSWYKSFAEKVTITVWNFISDLTDEETQSAHDSKEDDGPPLAVKTLKDNMRRFSSGLKPVSEFFKKANWVVSWNNPAATMLIFLVYLFSFWHGHTISLVLFLGIVQLSANFVYIKFGNLSAKDEIEAPVENSASWSDRFQVVLHVAKKVQNYLGSASNYLEKIRNLLTWKVPHVTFKLYLVLWILLVLSVVLSGPQFFMLFGMLLGYKLFINNPLYKRFPKLRKRHDTTLKLWNELPIDCETGVQDGRSNELEESQVSTHAARQASLLSSMSEITSFNSKLFCERYKLTSDEVLVKGWEDGWRTSLMNKQRPLVNIKHGRLYLTQNYLCFERSRTNIEKNILLKLSDIRCVNKYKPLFILPGTGMSIEVCMKDRDEPYVFGAILGRDDAYRDIIQTGRDAELLWAGAA